MADLLYEVGAEEIPAGYIAPALEQLGAALGARAGARRGWRMGRSAPRARPAGLS